MLLCGVTRSIRDNVLIETYGRSYAVERLARHHLRAHLRKEALVTVWELYKEVVRRNALDNGIAQELEALVVDVATILQLHRCRLMDKRKFIQLDVVWDEAKHIIDYCIEVLIDTIFTAKGSKNKIEHCNLTYYRENHI